MANQCGQLIRTINVDRASSALGIEAVPAVLKGSFQENPPPQKGGELGFFYGQKWHFRGQFIGQSIG
jgi:hypothetical protein